ncbi:hypothetical protein LCGC14_2667520 [marine sediment metagenome]|uniref:Uncharacterized protein n=1 Tax=marine sediment metagenome TaxID=412755 RepID=A0A0F8ZQ17_9ZZZZ
MKIDEKVTVERERDNALRAHEYVVITHDKEGNEVEYISFYVADSGKIYSVKDPRPLP